MNPIMSRPRFATKSEKIGQISDLLATNVVERRSFLMDPVSFLHGKELDIDSKSAGLSCESFSQTSEACTAVAFCGVAVFFVAGAFLAIAAVSGTVAYTVVLAATEVSVSTGGSCNGSSGCLP